MPTLNEPLVSEHEMAVMTPTASSAADVQWNHSVAASASMKVAGDGPPASSWVPNKDLSDDPEAIKERLQAIDVSDFKAAVTDVKDTVADLAGWDKSDNEKASETVKRRNAKQKRMEKFLNSRAAGLKEARPELASCIFKFNHCFSIFITIIFYTILPFYVALYLIVYRVMAILPWNMLQMIFGFTLCFFGGDYPLTLAAFEAFWHMGGYRCYDDVEYVVATAKDIREEEERATSEDSKYDWESMSMRQIFQTQVKIAMMQVTEPRRLMRAMGNLWSAFAAVIMVLKLRFAFLIALALGVAHLVEFPVLRALGPPVGQCLGPDLSHWTETIITSSLKVLSIYFAFSCASIICAYYSALRGGDLFAEGFLNLLDHRGYLQPVLRRIYPSLSQARDEEIDPDDCNFGEIISYGVAALGFYFQWVHHFEPPFPFSVILIPVRALEDFLLACIVLIDTNPHAEWN